MLVLELGGRDYGNPLRGFGFIPAERSLLISLIMHYTRNTTPKHPESIKASTP